MNLSTMNNKQQLVWAISIVITVSLLYVFFRYTPEVHMITALKSEVKSTQKKLAKHKKKTAPKEDLDTLLVQLKDQEKAIEFNKEHAAELEARLAPFDSQELKLRISQLANTSNLVVKQNETVKSFPVNNPVTQQIKKKKTTNKSAVKTNTLLPETYSWVSRMSPGTLLYRPMQRLSVHGYYASIQEFIYGLDSLPWQVTVLKLSINKMPVMAPAGRPQLLQAEIVLAL